MSVLDDPRADPYLLEEFQFDRALWQSQIEQLSRVPEADLVGTVRGTIVPAAGISRLRLDDSANEVELFRLGRAALSHGEVAVLIVNGGLATRFGGAAKGIVEVLPGRSFLAFKLGDVVHAEQVFGGHIPVVLMNSFATRAATLAHLDGHRHFGLDRNRLFAMDQTISIRLATDGSPFVGDDGRLRYFAPGHGEFFEVMLRSGLHDRLRSEGVRWLLFANVDNLGASIEPRLLGHHIRSGVDMTVEVTEKRRDLSGQWDVGGAPVTIDGRTQVVEGFRFPPDFDQGILPDFQTNNMLFTLDALAEPFPLPRYLVRKRVEGRDSLTFEAVTCEASGVLRPDGTARLSLGMVRVPRDGVRGRFFPVKSRQDLDAIGATVAQRVEQGWRLREREARL